MKKTMKTLTANQQIRMKQFDRFKREVKVGTIQDFYSEIVTNETTEEIIAKAQKAGHALAWTNQSAGVLTANYPGKAEAMARKDEAYAAAVELENGELVEIEGRLYTVLFIGADYSDPVHFVPAKVKEYAGSAVHA